MSARPRAPQAVSRDGAAPANGRPRVELGAGRHKPVSLTKLVLVRLILIAAAVGLWALASGRLVDSFYVSSPADVASQLWTWLKDGTITSNLVVTLEEIVIGFALGAVAGIVAGMGLGLLPRVGAIIEPFAQALYSVPKIALVPLFVVWFGIGILPKILVAAVSVFFVVFFTTFAGVREVDQNFIDVLRVMGAKRGDVLRKVVFPSTLAWVFAGLTISVPQAFTGAIAGEILVSNRGLGYLVSVSAANFNQAGVFAALIVIVIVAALMGAILKLVERRAMRWKAV